MPKKHEVITQIAAKVRSGADMQKVAMTLAREGVAFFPCTQKKTPCISGWQKLTAVDESQVREWWSKWPHMLLGLPTGQNGLFVIDLDKAKNAGEPDGLEEFQFFCGKHGYDFMADTLCARTGSGGLHVFYQMPAGHKLRNTAKRLGNAIDTRGDGGYVIIAPSKGERGKYEWLNEQAIAFLPDWLFALLERDKQQQAARPLQKTVSICGGYVNERERKAYQRALVSECANVATAVEGTRNDCLNMASYNLGRYVGAGKLDEAEVYNELDNAAQKCGLAHGEIARTISSGLNSGKQEPKTIEPYGGSWESRKNIVKCEARAISEPIREESQLSPLEKYLAGANSSRLIDGFLDAAREFAESSAIPTGYPNLDTLLDGGLYPGLYIIGAISSLGKTTFVLQMADAIAQACHDVLIFSLEMSKHELIAKTISRISKNDDMIHERLEEKAKTARYYLSGKWCIDNTSVEETSMFYKLLDIYAQWAEHIYIIEGYEDLTVKKIIAKTKEHIRLTGNKPIVIVDYLQILSPLSDRYTDKQNVDRNIVELKRLSRDFKLPVIAVSSFNRESYSTKVTMSAFKESGAIEYTSDVLIGLQFEGINNNFDIEAAKNANPREIELVLIKNRHGRCGNTKFKYYPKFNLFMAG